jgi:hypothetical protein
MNPKVERVVIYPWIALKTPVTVCGVEFLPRDVAVERADGLGGYILAATSYFYDYLMDGAPDFNGTPLTLRPLEPSVVLLNDTTTTEHVERANLVWFFSVMFANNLGFRYANATVFQHFYQNIGSGEPGVYARRTRRMHGTKLDGAMSANIVETRPIWCGSYHEPDATMLALLEEVIDQPDAKPIRECIKALLTATSDNDTMLPDEEHANFARAAERLLHRLGQTSKTRDVEQRALGKALLEQVVPSHSGGWQIMEVRDAMRDQRNTFWHPEGRKNGARPFENQTAIRPNLVAFHATTALLVATARALLGRDLGDELTDYVEAVEEWVASIKENDPRPSDEASDWSAVLRAVRLRKAVGRFMCDNPELKEPAAT